VGRGEEVQRDVGREDLLWEGGLEQGRETFLEDAQSWEAWVSTCRSAASCRMGLGGWGVLRSLLPNFALRSSGGLLGPWPRGGVVFA
jgi:hypothetical protein